MPILTFISAEFVTLSKNKNMFLEKIKLYNSGCVVMSFDKTKMCDKISWMI